MGMIKIIWTEIHKLHYLEKIESRITIIVEHLQFKMKVELISITKYLYKMLKSKNLEIEIQLEKIQIHPQIL